MADLKNGASPAFFTESVLDPLQSHENLKRKYHDKTKNTCEPVVMHWAAFGMSM
jgi:hypothetical protein